METAQVGNHHPKIVAALFGEDAIGPGRGRRIHDAASRFATDVTVNAWNSWRMGIKRHRTAISKLEIQVDDQWEGSSHYHSKRSPLNSSA